MKLKNGEKLCNNCKNDMGNIKKHFIDNKRNRKLLYIIAIIILTIIISILILSKNNNKNLANDTDIDYNNTSTNETTKVYITKDSEVSPTGKEFIGDFTQTLRDYLGYDNSVYFETSIKDTSISNLKQYICVGYSYMYNVNPKYLKDSEKEKMIKDGKATKGNIILKEIIYYNDINNKIIAHRIINYNTNATIDAASKTYSSPTEYLDTKFESNISMFMNFPNDQSNDKLNTLYKDYCDMLNKRKITEGTLQNGVNTYLYNIFGNDLLYVNLKLLAIGNQLDELYLAYDENSDPEETIKKWYSIVCDVKDTNNIENSSINNDNSNINNSGTSTSSNNSNNQKETIQVPLFSVGKELEYYTKELNKLKIQYKVVKEQNVNYDDNTVIAIEHNGEKIEKGTSVTITVADNIYNMDVYVSTGYLLGLAGLGYDYEEVNITLKINGTNICNGTFKRDDIYTSSPIRIGNYKGKADDLKLDITIEGIKINKQINCYVIDSHNGSEPSIYIYAGGDINPG